jgi:hypothetical protein
MPAIRTRRFLPQFVCSRPPQRLPVAGRPRIKPREREWEALVQSGVRNMRPPARAGQLMLVGEDDVGFGAVAWSEQVSGPGDVFLKALALEQRLRGQGGAYADEMCTEVIDRLAERADAAGESELKLSWKVDKRKNPSRALCLRTGAVVVGMINNAIEEWLLVIDLR